jgi:hypothetical protein
MWIPCLLFELRPLNEQAILTGVVAFYWLKETTPRTLELLGYKMQMAFLVDSGALDSSIKYDMEEVVQARANPSFLSIFKVYNMIWLERCLNLI